MYPVVLGLAGKRCKAEAAQKEVLGSRKSARPTHLELPATFAMLLDLFGMQTCWVCIAYIYMTPPYVMKYSMATCSYPANGLRCCWTCLKGCMTYTATCTRPHTLLLAGRVCLGAPSEPHTAACLLKAAKRTTLSKLSGCSLRMLEGRCACVCQAYRFIGPLSHQPTW